MDKKGKEILEFEECVEDSGGILLDFARVPKTVEEDPKKKGKGKAQEDVKAFAGKAWIDLKGFQEPGKDELLIRSKLEEHESGEGLFKDTSMTPQTDPTYEFRREIKLSALKIAAEYHKKFVEQQGDNLRKLAVSRQKELREGRKETFLYEFNLSGKAQTLKEKLKKAIVNIINDSLLKKGHLTGLDHTDKDRFLSEIYAYLIEQMQANVDEIIKERKEEFHEDIVIPWDLATREKELSHINAPKETIDDKLLRLANEYEMQGKIEKATEFHKERACREPKSVNV